MRIFPTLFVLAMASLLATEAQAYSISFLLEKRSFISFEENSYSYSSMFRQGRDNFHWIDLSYSNYDYVLKDEQGRAQSIGSFYRFANRRRWARYFKPAVFTGIGFSHRNLSKRQSISTDNIIIGDLDEATKNEFTATVGVGYLWEIKRSLVGISFSYGYDFGYERAFYAPAFIFSFDL